MYKELVSEVSRFKAEEMARMDRKIEDSRVGMRREMEFLYSQNIQALNVGEEHVEDKTFSSFCHSLTRVFHFIGSESESDSQA